MTMHQTRLTPAGALLVTLLTALYTAQAQPMRVLDTPYYTIKTNVSDEDGREAALRMTAMFEEYTLRTRGFAGAVTRKMPFELHRDYDDYVRSSDAPGTAGVYTGHRLVASFEQGQPERTWHTVQHEGFHQFVDLAMGSDAIPIWANEGLAEYFGEGAWTGDGFVTGLIPPKRLARVQELLKAQGFRSLLELMTISHEQWNQEANVRNYDHAWMLVHFLAHADNGKYADRFAQFLRQARGVRDWQRLWASKFGADVGALEKRWREWWLTLPEHPTRDLYVTATCATLTSFYARAFAERQQFERVEDFFEAARADTLKCKPQAWLPKSLLDIAVTEAPRCGQWRLEKRGAARLLICERPDGAKWEGSYRLGSGGVIKEVIAKQIAEGLKPRNSETPSSPSSRRNARNR